MQFTRCKTDQKESRYQTSIFLARLQKHVENAITLIEGPLTCSRKVMKTRVCHTCSLDLDFTGLEGRRNSKFDANKNHPCCRVKNYSRCNVQQGTYISELEECLPCFDRRQRSNYNSRHQFLPQKLCHVWNFPDSF